MSDEEDGAVKKKGGNTVRNMQKAHLDKLMADPVSNCL